MKVIVYRNNEENYGAGLVFVEITNKKFGNGQTPEQLWDECSDYIKLGMFDLPLDFLDAIGFEVGCMHINLSYEE